MMGEHYNLHTHLPVCLSALGILTQAKQVVVVICLLVNFFTTLETTEAKKREKKKLDNHCSKLKNRKSPQKLSISVLNL